MTSTSAAEVSKVSDDAPLPVSDTAVIPTAVIPGTCPMPNIAQLIGGKWKLIILQILLFQGMKRFNELRRQIDGITQTMLTNQLRALERDGLVSRKVYAEVPPRVEYRATQRAQDLEEMFHAMHNWWLKGQQQPEQNSKQSSKS